jgi:4-aminobutyrate aminotransferase/(S)-3-amino-2-methylpropionate transaminase
MDAPTPGGLGGTYGGNAVACAAALAVLDVFEDDNLLQRGRSLADQLRAGLLELQSRHAPIGEVRGLGFMLALEFVGARSSRDPAPEIAQAVIDGARERGLLVIKCGVHRNVVRFLCPLVAEEADIADALAILDAAIAHATTAAA